MPVSLGNLADELYAKNAEIAQANAHVKDLEREKREIEAALLQAMDLANTTAVRGTEAAVSINEVIRPNIQDFDALAAFVLRKKALHLFERRISATAYREMRESMKRDIPGLSEYTQRRLNVRKV